MSIPLATVLAAAPGIISAAADLIKLARNRKTTEPVKNQHEEQIEGLVSLIEKQAVLIEEMAKSNQELAIAVRNNRILALTSIAIALAAILILILK